MLTLSGAGALLGGGLASSVQDLEQRIPGFTALQNFFKKWLNLDITTILAVAALMGAASSGVASLQNTGSRIYWWVVRFLTASISIAGKDRLNREVINWLGANVLTKSGTRILTANSETIRSDARSYYRRSQERNDFTHDKRPPVQYLPTFGVTWFIHKRNIFMVRRILTSSSHYNSAWSIATPEEYAGAPDGGEPLVVMCLGRSVEPIKRFLEECRDFADKQSEAYVTVRSCKSRSYDESWDTTILRPLRPIETVHFDEKTKEELVADITSYLDSTTRRFYNQRGIPYRRGYLLHGPPGTGKTSLSLALAGMFGLELYLLHMPSVREDSMLDKLFTSLPPKCMVLMEDIDAVGMKRRVRDPDDDDEDSDDDSKEEDEDKYNRSNVTLSGLLNVLDGVASQEGRIVLMTSNFADKLDEALVRPGRVDRKIYLGNISPRSCELMFLRMYAKKGELGSLDAPSGADPQLQEAALEFSRQIPDERFTPAQLQGFLLTYRSSYQDAVANIGPWVSQEVEKMDAAKDKAKRLAEQRKKKRREAKLKALAKAARKELAKDDDSDAELEALRKEVEESRKEKIKRKKADLNVRDDSSQDGHVEAPQEVDAKTELNGDAGTDTNEIEEADDSKPQDSATAAEETSAEVRDLPLSNGVDESRETVNENVQQ